MKLNTGNLSKSKRERLSASSSRIGTRIFRRFGLGSHQFMEVFVRCGSYLVAFFFIRSHQIDANNLQAIRQATNLLSYDLSFPCEWPWMKLHYHSLQGTFGGTQGYQKNKSHPPELAGSSNIRTDFNRIWHHTWLSRLPVTPYSSMTARG
jgi:hypothetical protein